MARTDVAAMASKAALSAGLGPPAQRVEAEIPTEIATVSANLIVERAGDPRNERDRHEQPPSTQRCGDDRARENGSFIAPPAARSKGRKARFERPLDVFPFHHHDRIVDLRADRGNHASRLSSS